MSARTLAERFRMQRTDRIRVEGVEVFSMYDLVLDGFSALEVVVESSREDVEQSLALRSRSADLSIESSTLGAPTGPAELLQISGSEQSRSEIHGNDASRTVVQLWNSWRVGDCDHAWTGNAGIIVEELPIPGGADERVRLWCSDGLGDPTFDDLVVMLTVGPRQEN